VGVSIHVVGDNLYTVEATRPGYAWTSSEPIASQALIAKLESLGFHGKDVIQAIYDADPAWRA
jgi:hypothetical protein